MADIIQQAYSIINGVSENTKTMNAPTLGLGFHQFDGDVSVKEVLHQIGADFTVRKEPLYRIPYELDAKIRLGEPVTIDPKYLIGTHSATVCLESDKTIGIVGKDYGIIQNARGLEILDLITNSSVDGTSLKIVSAGLVHDFEPYIQARLGSDARIDGDNSDTEFYAFFHNTHDGSSAMKVTFTAIRVICRNTFNANLKAKTGMMFKHSKNVGVRVDFSRQESIDEIKSRIEQLNIFKKEYIERMNSYRLAKVTEDDINQFVANLFIDDEEILALAAKNGYNYDTLMIPTKGGDTKNFPTVTKNKIRTFRDILESGDGQDTNRGTKLWLFNATTNYLSHDSYGNGSTDNDLARATKRFDSMMKGSAYNKMNAVYELLAV
jgi:hypothetical protein